MAMEEIKVEDLKDLVGEQMRGESLEIIRGSEILSTDMISYVESIMPDLAFGFKHAQTFRTRTEMEVSVLDDLKHPTADAKYWQAMREQQVHFSELVMLSYEYKKNLKEIEILEAEIDELEHDLNNKRHPDWKEKKIHAEIDLKSIEIERKTFIAANHQRTAGGRFDEIANWKEIIDILRSQLQFSATDVNEHQLGSYLARFINNYLTMIKQVRDTQAISEAINITALLVTTMRAAERKGVLDPILQQLPKKEVALLKSTVKSYAPTNVDLIEKIDDIKEVTQ